MRDTYGNRMLGDFHDQLLFHTAGTDCNPRDPEDPLCAPVDEAGAGGWGGWLGGDGTLGCRAKIAI